jgi:hypothetical protein
VGGAEGVAFLVEEQLARGPCKPKTIQGAGAVIKYMSVKAIAHKEK